MPTPSILTQINAPTPQVKANNGGSDTPKSNVDSNTPSTFKKMLNSEVNQQQKLKNEASSKIKEAKKTEQKNNVQTDVSSKVAQAEAESENKDKSIAPKLDKKITDNLVEIDSTKQTENQPINILNFVENIGLLNDQIQLQMAQAAPKNDASIIAIVEEQSQETIEPLQVTSAKNGKELLNVADANNLSPENDAFSQENLALSNKDPIASITTKKNNTNDTVIANNVSKIDASLILPSPINMAAVKTSGVVDKSKPTLNVTSDKTAKGSTKAEIVDATAGNIKDSNAKDSNSKIQFESHINNALNQQRQNTPIELENKGDQDFASIRMHALNTQQINAAPDSVKAGAIANYIPAPLGSKAWDQAMGQRMIWMVAGGEQSAQLTLNPPDLGPLQIILKITDNQVDASFISSHLDVRETIESAMPKLRQMMDEAGIQLSGFSVDSQASQSNNAFNQEQNQQKTRGVNSSSQLSTDSIDGNVDNTPRVGVKKEIGLVDTFV